MVSLHTLLHRVVVSQAAGGSGAQQGCGHSVAWQRWGGSETMLPNPEVTELPGGDMSVQSLASQVSGSELRDARGGWAREPPGSRACLSLPWAVTAHLVH